MGRIEKDKNLYKFYVDGKDKPYVLDVNTGSITPDFNGQTVLCIGKVSLKCLK